MNYLEEYKKLSKEWFLLKRDPEATNQEIENVNKNLNKL